MNNPSLDCTVCMVEGAGTPSSKQPILPKVGCTKGVEHFRGRGRRRGGGRRGGRYRRGYRNWRGGYSGFGYYPYWYGSNYYWPSYYDYPYVSRGDVLTGVVEGKSVGGQTTFVIALIALVVAFFALRK